MKSLHIVAAVILLGALAAPSMAQSRVLELGHEASASTIRLPERADGELTLQRCATCQVLRLRAGASTRYVIGGQIVTLVEMTQYLARHPKANLVVMQLKNTSDLSRLVVHATNRAQ
jgi:hypothetical protein